MIIRPSVVRHGLMALALIGAASPICASVAPDKTESRNREAVRRAFDAWSSGTGHVFDLLSPDVRWTVAGSGPFTGTFIGKDAFRTRAAAPLVDRLATPLKPRVHHIWASGERVIVRFDASATTTAGAPYSNQYVWILRLDQGRIVEGEAFLDMDAYRAVVKDSAPIAK